MTISNPIKFWWWNGVGAGNLGDVLTPLILDYFDIPWELTTEFEAISTGSIVKVARTGTIVMGSGIISQRDPACPDADYRFVRGPYTRKRILECGGSCEEIYGDPAMLMPLIVPEPPKIHDLAIIPHYSHYDWAKEQYPDHVVIQLRTFDCVETIKQIAQCRRVVSSSLHGIILAHAYGIPVAWTEFDTCGTTLKGDGIKFLDHFASVNAEPIKSSVEDPVFTMGSLDLDPLIEQFHKLCDQIQ